MSTLTDGIWQALRAVPYPGYNRDIVSFGLVQRVAECDGAATIVLGLESLAPETRNQLMALVHAALRPLPGLRSVELQLTPPRDVRPHSEHPRAPHRLEGVRQVVAVGSGKGGVGKSTVAVNLAVAMAECGVRVGLLDADAYGPNVPRMMGVGELPPPQQGKIRPAEAYGVRIVSIGLMVERETPLVWRGPMTDKMVRQFLTDVAWGELDVLVVDLPPSTGDIPVSLAAHVQVDGAVIVVSPQAVASDDALKAIGMFRRLGVPLLGVVENMSYFQCTRCGTRHYLFGQGGGRELARVSGIRFLGEVPIESCVREGGDRGRPAVLLVDSAAGVALREVAELVREQLESRFGPLQTVTVACPDLAGDEQKGISSGDGR
jgi:ATP-binding protein involved in chromosome partitioning